MKGKLLGDLLASPMFKDKNIAYVNYTQDPRGEIILRVTCFDPSEEYEFKKLR